MRRFSRKTSKTSVESQVCAWRTGPGLKTRSLLWIPADEEPILPAPLFARSGRGRFFPRRDCLSQPLVPLSRPGQSHRHVYGCAAHREHHRITHVRAAAGYQLARIIRLAMVIHYRRNAGGDLWRDHDLLSDGLAASGEVVTQRRARVADCAIGSRATGKTLDRPAPHPAGISTSRSDSSGAHIFLHRQHRLWFYFLAAFDHQESVRLIKFACQSDLSRALLRGPDCDPAGGMVV